MEMSLGNCFRKAKMKNPILILIAVAVVTLLGSSVYAATPAGTQINNKAVLNYILNGSGLSMESNVATITVEEGAVVSVAKSAVVKDQSGGDKAVSGAIITYTLAVTVLGNGTAAGVVITDPIPANTTYMARTLRLDGSELSDVKDGDAGDVGGTTAETVTVTLGDMTGVSGTKTITFDVKIK